jgi:hypothetical protein
LPSTNINVNAELGKSMKSTQNIEEPRFLNSEAELAFSERDMQTCGAPVAMVLISQRYNSLL